MVNITREIKKSITVGKVKKERRGKYTLKLFSPAELDTSTSRVAVKRFDEDALETLLTKMDALEIAKWVDYGRLAHARITFSNMLGGTDSDFKNLEAQFRENVSSVVKYVGKGMSEEQLVELENKVRADLLADEEYASVKRYYESFESGGVAEFLESDLDDPTWFEVKKQENVTEGPKEDTEEEDEEEENGTEEDEEEEE